MELMMILPLLTVTVAGVICLISYRQIKKDYSKTVKIDITREQMLILEKKVTDFYKENNLNPDGNIERITELLKLKVGKDDENLEHQAKTQLPDEDGYREVTINPWLSQQERTFVIAHECAHLINGDDMINTRPQGHNKPICEQLADYTAAALLMPLEDVYEYLEKINYQKLTASKRVKVITQLSVRYEVEPVVALRRVKEVYIIKQNRQMH